MFSLHCQLLRAQLTDPSMGGSLWLFPEIINRGEKFSLRVQGALYIWPDMKRSLKGKCLFLPACLHTLVVSASILLLLLLLLPFVSIGTQLLWPFKVI